MFESLVMLFSKRVDNFMGDVIPFKKPKPSEKHKGKTLCKNGFHKWEVDKKQVFNVKLGRLVTVYRCKRCGELKHKLE